MTRLQFRPALGLIAVLLPAFLILGAFAAPAESFPGPDTPGIPASASAQARGKVNPPRITKRKIPFGPKRKREMAAYSKRHYGERQWRLKKPNVIVQHYSVTPNISALFNTFASDRPDPEFGELPNVCAHFGVTRSGRIFQFVGLRARCRHAVGLNYTAIGIEHVGYSDGEVLSNAAQMRGSIKLTRWLRCRYDIPIKDVIGHNESLRSKYHRERIKALKRATHGDFRRKSMDRYRRQLRRTGQC